jgi:hypothetical protein
MVNMKVIIWVEDDKLHFDGVEGIDPNKGIRILPNDKWELQVKDGKFILNFVGKDGKEMDKKLVNQLKRTILDAESFYESNDWNYIYFLTSLSNARGLYAAIDHPPKGREEYVTDEMLKRAIWNLKNSMVNKI